MSVYQDAKGSPVLKGVIVVLLGILLYVIYEPYQIREEEEMYRRESRARMVNIRQAQLLYISDHLIYCNNLDTLVAFVKAKPDSVLISQFKPLVMSPFAPESLLHTPKTSRPYKLATVDTTVIKKYFLEDPDGYGSIGTLTDDTRVNKASWEE
ncbi:MAG TPA: hypothetical protein VGA55_03330 [Bacteroidota bacterium]